MKRVLLVLVIVSFIFSLIGNVFAAPGVNSVSGTVSDGNSITITGTAFGNAPNVVIFDDFEGGNNNQLIPSGSGSATFGDWGYSRTATYSNLHKVSGSLAMRADMSSSDQYGQVRAYFPESQDIFVSFWMYLPAGDYFPGEDNQYGTNWKLMWAMRDQTAQNDDIMAPVLLPDNIWRWGGNDDCIEHIETWGPNSEPRVDLGFNKGEWKRAWFWIRGRSDTSGQLGYWTIDSQGVHEAYRNDGLRVFCNPGDAFARLNVNGYGRASSNSHPTFDDIYVATGTNARARIEIGNAPVYADNTNLAITTPTSWGQTSVTTTVRQGSFNPGDTAYLFVVDSDNVASPGYPVTIGSGGQSCTNGQTRACQTGQSGICAQGTETCNSGSWSGTCVRDNAPIIEVCGDGIDQDCSGSDLSCQVCSEGQISSRCSCGATDYETGFCCSGSWQQSSCESSSSGPTINSIGGSLTDGSTVTISGSGFGTKTQAAPLKYDDFESGALGRSVTEVDFANGGWDGGGKGSPDYDPKYSNDYSHTGSQSAVALFSGGQTGEDVPGDASNFGIYKHFPLPKIYLDTWVYLPNDPPYGRNYKIFRVQPEVYNGNGNLYLQLFCDSYDHIIFEQDNVAAPTYSERLKYLRNYQTEFMGRGGLDYSYFEKNWVHLQMWIEESSMGVSDGTAIFWIDGAKVVDRVDNFRTRNAGSSYWSVLWLGNYYSTRAGDGCAQYNPNPDPRAYFDNVYIDTSRARVEIGASSVYDVFETKHVRDIQIPSSWSDGSITFKVNQGSFNAGDTAYLFVINEDGNVSSGYPITIGSGSSAVCNDGTCDGGETCTSCPQDCLLSGQVCCSSVSYVGECCSSSDCSVNENCINNLCQLNYISNVNLALNKSVTASNEAYVPAARMADGIVDVDSNYWGAQGSPNWAIIDLGQDYNVDRIKVNPFGVGAGIYYYVNAWNIQYATSLEPNIWKDFSGVNKILGAGTLLSNGINITGGNPGHTNSDEIYKNYEFSFTPVNARYVRYFVTEGDGDGDGSAAELEVYASQETMYHEADTTLDGCVSLSEANVFINRWKNQDADVTIRDIISMLAEYKKGCG